MSGTLSFNVDNMGVPITILVADDDEDDYVIIRDLLSEAAGSQYHVDWTSTYEEALMSFEQAAYDVFFFDYHLGEYLGVDLLQDLTHHGNPANVILLTESGGMEADYSAMETSASNYLVKDELTAPLLALSIRYTLKLAEITKKLHQLETHDQLTGLLNRREMDRILTEEFFRYQRYQHPFAFLILNIDRFKGINDNFGHKAGDDVLCEIADRVVHKMRLTDRVVRYGYEEIVIIAPNTDAKGALALAERGCQTIAEEPFTVKGENEQPHQIPVPASIGVAVLPDHADSTKTLIAAADQALYAAKENGRNCAVLAG